MMRKELLVALGAAALLLVAAAAVRYAQSLDMVTAGTARRAMQVVTGLWLAVYANRMPKQIGAWSSSIVAAARAQSALRVGGWCLTLGGLAYAVIWAVAPLGVARLAAVSVLGTATLVTAFYGAWTVAACRRTHRPATGQS